MYRRIACELLESKRLQANLLTVNGVVTVLGTELADDIHVAVDSGELNLIVRVNADVVTVPADDVHSLHIRAGAGTDRIENKTKFDCVFDAGDGDDTIIGGTGVSRLLATPGFDLVSCGFSIETIFDYSGFHGITTFEVSLGVGAEIGGVPYVFDALAWGPKPRFVATDGDDRIRGSHEPNWYIDAGAGDDDIDLFLPIVEGATATINAGAGNDTITTGETGASHLFAGPGDDTMILYGGARFVDGGTGHDDMTIIFENTSGVDITLGPGVEDATISSSGPLIIRGNELDNRISGGGEITTVYGMGGNDTILSDPEFAFGGEGDDRLIQRGPGNTVFSGGPGIDTVDYSLFAFAEPLAVVVSLDGVANDGYYLSPGGNILEDVENIVGSALADTLKGSEGANEIWGGGGDDEIHVASGEDTIFAGPGDDVVIVDGVATAVFQQQDDLAVLRLLTNARARLDMQVGAISTKLISLAPTAQLDLADNALILDYTGPSPIESIRAQLQSGYADGAWIGPGIASSSAAADARFGVGFADSASLFSSLPGVFAGQTVDDSALLLRYTRNGDTDLNGTVDMADFSRLAANFNATTNRWSAGDFNYDGVSGFGDFARLAAGFQVGAQTRFVSARESAARPFRQPFLAVDRDKVAKFDELDEESF